ncbi:uncharacterized protein LY89DRAFT_596637 [Mollisia scopiformis]|uniref:F-box domain-containing protein n=1 Tax=Mollisia scopiformis TaxID=149040 RepID=A0A132BDS0_MOLSC|nr:uncharacterized protein LY89DRAFT_596637 [Mollisia scopiformis]KUJ10531.1 hypothetical protein LY89DRAFT_596637 [Mollisia scopiformis]
MLEDTCPLDNGRHEDPPNTLFSIGDLNRLPLEILQGILVDGIDFASLTSLRRVSRGMRSTIDSLPKYKAIVTHAPASIRAALSLETGIYWSCSHLYHELCSNACVFCGHFGANLNVLICKRVCIDCFTTDVQCLPVGREYAKATWSLKESDLKNSDTRIPTARTLPWYYVTRLFSKGHASRKRIELLEHTAVGAIAINKYGSLDVILQQVN